MDLLLIRALWGIDQSWQEALSRIHDAGFHGIEAPLPHMTPREDFTAALTEYDFRCIPMIFTEGDTVDAHIASFREQVEAALRYKPLLINAHDGRDAWSEDESSRYFEAVLAIENDLGAKVAHETHRGRILFNPWVTDRMLARFPELQLCCDFSHWVCVCERLIDDQMDILARCAERALHLHARVGYEEGPQVPDPRAPAYARHLEAHERWWDLIWTAQQQRGFAFSTLTPEFGPPPYLQTLPYTEQPVADLWGICSWQAERQADRFSTIYQHHSA